MSTAIRSIAVTGGIGCGKSLVCEMLRCLGYAVYDCDSRARWLMSIDADIIEAVSHDVCSEAVVDGKINRDILGKCVFASPTALSKLNTIVHGAVRGDFLKWREDLAVSIMESAILYTSAMDALVTEVWEVTAPIETRINRVLNRDPHLTEADVMRRIEAQKSESDATRHPHTYCIVNDGLTPLLPQIEHLLQV